MNLIDCCTIQQSIDLYQVNQLSSLKATSPRTLSPKIYSPTNIKINKYYNILKKLIKMIEYILRMFKMTKRYQSMIQYDWWIGLIYKLFYFDY